MKDLEILFDELKKWKSAKSALEDRLSRYDKTFRGSLVVDVRFKTKNFLHKFFSEHGIREESFTVTPKIAHEVLVEVIKREIEQIASNILETESKIESYIKQEGKDDLG